MAVEIERKFLVTNTNYKMGIPHQIAQGYICSDKDRVVRIRIIDDNAFVTIKNSTIGFARNEYEYPIPVQDAREMLQNTCIQPIISKTRYVLDYKGKIWEIDEFHGLNEGLVIAELELENENDSYEKPDFVGDEVTGNPQYYNALLFKNPYINWK